MKIAGIVGANGFIGSRTVEKLLLEQRVEVRPIVRSTSSMQRLTHLDLQPYAADALDSAALYTAFGGCDVVVHAAMGSPWFVRKAASLAYKAAEKAKVKRFIYLSSAVVHGQAPEPGTNEDSPLNTNQPFAYNNAKIQAERELLHLRKKGEVEVVLLRPGIVVGPHSGWITGFADAILAGTACLYDGGKGICNSIYIDNLVHAINLAMTAPNADGQAFLVGDQEEITWADLYQPVAHTFGVEISQIPNAPLPNFQYNWKKQVLESLRNSGAVNTTMNFLPKQWQSVFKRQAKQSLKTSSVAPELALLYQCQYKLPYAKAERILGYKPLVSFTEACDRTTEWLGRKYQNHFSALPN